MTRAKAQQGRAGGRRPQSARAGGHDGDGGLTEDDLYLFNEGTHRQLALKMGAHLAPEGGTWFSVWAPSATQVAVVGDFNSWDPTADLLSPRGVSGIWQAHLTRSKAGDVYKFAITTSDGDVLYKADPFALCTEVGPGTASVVWDLGYEWNDGDWMSTRAAANALDAPMSVYEVHLGSWRRDPADPRRLLHYREMAEPLIEHVRGCGFTHVEFLPIDGAPVLRVVGVPDDGVLRSYPALRRPAGAHGAHRPPPSCRDRCHLRLGPLALSRAMPTRSAASTARTCSSTPTRASASTRTGRASSSTTGATRSAASSPPRPSTGSPRTTSTGYASMPSPR